MNNCKYETSNGRCGLKGSYAYRHKCFGEDMCKCNEPKTNADHIRSMTDEELAAEIVLLHTTCEVCAKNEMCGEILGIAMCVEGVRDWLKQPCKEDGA